MRRPCQKDLSASAMARSAEALSLNATKPKLRYNVSGQDGSGWARKNAYPLLRPRPSRAILASRTSPYFPKASRMCISVASKVMFRMKRLYTLAVDGRGDAASTAAGCASISFRVSSLLALSSCAARDVWENGRANMETAGRAADLLSCMASDAVCCLETPVARTETEELAALRAARRTECLVTHATISASSHDLRSHCEGGDLHLRLGGKLSELGS